MTRLPEIPQGRPGVDEGNDFLVRNQEQNGLARCERCGWGGCLRPRPGADGEVMQVEVVPEAASDTAVPHDTERARVERRYLSHRSGPLETEAELSTSVAVLAGIGAVPILA